MLRLCHTVPALVAVVLASGCFLTNGRGDPPACRDDLVCCDAFGVGVEPLERCPFACPAGSRAASFCSPEGFDGGTPHPPPPPVDAGPIRPPPMCMPQRGIAACLDTVVVQAEAPFRLPVLVDACSCCPVAECSVDLTSTLGAPTLNIVTTLCPDPCDCIACNDALAECDVPPLPEGTYPVVVNGSTAFYLTAAQDGGLVPPPPGCSTFAEPDLCAVGEAINTHRLMPDEVCLFGPNESPEHNQGWWMRTTYGCPDCAELLGPCDVVAERRLTTALPPGYDLRVTTQGHYTACDIDCGPGCFPRQLDCRVPDLEPGGYHRIFVNGTYVGDVSEGTHCLSAPTPPPEP
ncbi:MAG: hypothetical protein AB7S26_17405 [Sandaracinaceae bacterium]